MKKKTAILTAPSPVPSCEVCILAGGASSRMGRNKATLRLDGRTLLGHVRAAAKRLGLPVRVIRRDLIPNCGPLGGIHTALATSRAAGSLFLSCDMPFVSVALLDRVVRRFSTATQALFVREERGVGFPFLIRRDCLPVIVQQLDKKQFSLQALARVLRAKTFRLPPGQAQELFNVNTPAEWRQARKLCEGRSSLYCRRAYGIRSRAART